MKVFLKKFIKLMFQRFIHLKHPILINMEDYNLPKFKLKKTLKYSFKMCMILFDYLLCF
jgi:hypothetical protein